MARWDRWRQDLARGEVATGPEERPFLIASAVVVVVLAQLSDSGSVTEVLLVVGAGAALVLRGLAPRLPSELLAVLVTAPVCLAVAGDGDLEVTFFLGVMMTLYAAWHLGSTTRAVAVTAVSAAAPWLVSLLSTDELNWTAWASANLFMFVLGRNLRRQRELIGQLEEAREALADQAVADERRRIARELHDLAGHTLGAVLLHVTGARHVLRRDLDEAERALRDAEAVGRSSLDQVRATVAALRTTERGTDPPLAGAADIGRLVEQYRRAGLVVRVEVAPEAHDLVGPVGTALHRITREALANVARHAPENHVRVVIDVQRGPGAARTARLVVTDHGRPAGQPPRDEGHFGLIGMLERARSLGGDLDAGATGDGWRIEARLPLEAADRGPVAR